MIETNDAAFAEAMRAVVAERGEDYVYPAEWKDDDSCRYVRPDGEGPACLIGAALHKLGVTLGELSGWETTGADTTISHTTTGISVDVQMAACWAQGAQDEGKSWGEALATFVASQD